MSTAKSTWGGSKYATAYRKPGHYTGKFIAFEKSQKNDIDWFLKLSINGKDPNKVQVQSRWQNNPAKTEEEQIRTLNALAMMIANALNSVGIAYEAEELQNKTFTELVGLVASKGLIGKEVSYEISERDGESRKLQQIIFE